MNYLMISDTVLLPISARGGGIPGTPDRPWSKIRIATFINDAPAIFSLTVRREPPGLCAYQHESTAHIGEGALTALAIKTGPPSLHG